MSEVQAKPSIVVKGPFQTKQEHVVTADFLQAAIDDLMAVGNKIAYDMISDNSVRKQYQKHIQMMVAEIEAEVKSGKMNGLEGARTASGLREQLFLEYRKYTSAQGVAYAETLKLKPLGLEYYLNKYAAELYNGRKFSDLSEGERAEVYYKVMQKSAQDRPTVTNSSARLAGYGKVLILMTGAIAVWEIVNAKNPVREAARQGDIIAAGMIGGAIAGGAVSFVCGPAEPVCAFATVAIGSNLGGIAGEVISDGWDDALQFFRSFVWN